MTIRHPEPCPNCGSHNTTVAYGVVDDDANLPEEVKAGKLPIHCYACGKDFYGNWKGEND